MSAAAGVTVTTRKITMHGFQQEKRYSSHFMDVMNNTAIV